MERKNDFKAPKIPVGISTPWQNETEATTAQIMGQKFFGCFYPHDYSTGQVMSSEKTAHTLNNNEYPSVGLGLRWQGKLMEANQRREGIVQGGNGGASFHCALSKEHMIFFQKDWP